MGNINTMNLGQTEAETRIVKFGRDRQNPTTITITENGEYDVRDYFRAVVNVQGGGGGGDNPNTKEIVTGYCSSIPITEELLSEIASGDASALITIDLSALGQGEFTFPLVPQTGFALASVAALGSSVAESMALYVTWQSDGSLSDAKVLTMGNIMDLSAFFGNYEYSMVIYHHPMPEEA